MKNRIVCIFIIMLLIATFLPIVQSTDKIKENDINISLLPPDLAYDPISHDFGFVEEGDIYQTEFFIWNLGTGTLDWNLGIVNPWLSPNPTSGSSTGQKNKVTVTIDTTGLSTGSYSGSISIFANDGGGTRFFDVDFYVDTPPDTPSIPSGETVGLIDEEYSYYTSSNDDDFDWIAYRFDFGNRLTDWTMYTAPGIGNSVDNIWFAPGTYQVMAQAKDLHGSTSSWSTPLVVTISSGENNPPEKPSTPSGETNGKAGTSYSYSSDTTDIDGDQIYYLFDWGDGTDTDWKGPYNSGDSVTESHIWDAQGTYSVKIKAKDIFDEESVWSDPLSISMPKYKARIMLFANSSNAIWFVRGLFRFLDEDYIYLKALSAKLRGFGNGLAIYHLFFCPIKISKPFYGMLPEKSLPLPGIGICKEWDYT